MMKMTSKQQLLATSVERNTLNQMSESGIIVMLLEHIVVQLMNHAI